MKTNNKFNVRFSRGQKEEFFTLANSLREDVVKLIELGEIDARAEVVKLNKENDRLKKSVSDLEQLLKNREFGDKITEEHNKIKDELVEALRANNSQLMSDIQALKLKLNRVEKVLAE